MSRPLVILCSLLFIVGCGENKPHASFPKTTLADAQIKDVTSLAEEVLLPVAVAPPVVKDAVAPVAITPPIVALEPVSPVYNRGGSKNRPRLPCENGTSDCNDKNPCTIDTCDNDTCTHILDENKSEFGSCEQDGHSCTIGKCIEDGGKVQCFEQRREYIAGELGCQDNNQCTTDSCIEMPLHKELRTTKDGDVILNNQFQCVQEISSGLLCTASGCLSGFCEQTGTGMNPENPFMVGCVAPQNAPMNCPDTGNPCTINTCVANGCVEENMAANTPCDDGDRCTENEKCDGSGVCMGEPVDPQIVCGASPKQCRAFVCDSTLGCVLTGTADEGLACRTGDPCIENETCTAGICGNGSEVLCPTDGNVCTSDICKSGLGCIYEPITENPPDCSDNNNCTTEDACTDGVCLGSSLRNCATEPDNPCKLGFCDMTAEEDDEGCIVVDFTGPYGEDCTTPYPGICANGKLMCLAGDLTAMCEPLVRPGDKAEATCFSPEDYNCDGQNNACGCPIPPETTIYRYVDPAGDDNANNCANASVPCQTIAYAISQAVAGDTLLLAAGIFKEHDISVSKDLYIYGQGAGVSIVDAEQRGRVLFVNSAINTSICGLTITRGNSGNNGGGGIVNLGNITITSSIISGNRSGNDGGGIFTRGSMTINNSTISNNVAQGTGGITVLNGSAPTTTNIDNCTINNNSGIIGGILVITPFLTGLQSRDIFMQPLPVFA
jgi:hypothetical protein